MKNPIDWEQHVLSYTRSKRPGLALQLRDGMIRDQERQGNTDEDAGMQIVIGRSVAILSMVARAKRCAQFLEM